ncbi:Fur family transcriptional regulator [Patescibacteria group bacterium]
MNYSEKLISSTFRATLPRLRVLEYLQRNRKPKTIKEIYTHIRSEQIDLASIYRAIKVFQRLGFVFSDTILGKTAYYLSEKIHHHITCRRCHKVECLPCTVETPKPKSFKTIEHQLTLTGLCAKCAKLSEDN